MDSCPALVLRSPAQPDEGGCEADAVGTMEGSRFYPKPVCTHIFETRAYYLGVPEQAAPANVS
jgi:hypothetical protein